MPTARQLNVSDEELRLLKRVAVAKRAHDRAVRELSFWRELPPRSVSGGHSTAARAKFERRRRAHQVARNRLARKEAIARRALTIRKRVLQSYRAAVKRKRGRWTDWGAYLNTEIGPSRPDTPTAPKRKADEIEPPTPVAAKRRATTVSPSRRIADALEYAQGQGAYKWRAYDSMSAAGDKRLISDIAREGKYGRARKGLTAWARAVAHGDLPDELQMPHGRDAAGQLYKLDPHTTQRVKSGMRYLTPYRAELERRRMLGPLRHEMIRKRRELTTPSGNVYPEWRHSTERFSADELRQAQDVRRVYAMQSRMRQLQELDEAVSKGELDPRGALRSWRPPPGWAVASSAKDKIRSRTPPRGGSPSLKQWEPGDVPYEYARTAFADKFGVPFGEVTHKDVLRQLGDSKRVRFE